MRDILVSGDFALPSEMESFSNRIVHLKQLQSRDELNHHLKSIRSYILGGPEYLDAALLDYATNLRHLVVLGTGTPSFVDIASAQRRGILVENIPGINADAVSEFILGIMIAHNA